MTSKLSVTAAGAFVLLLAGSALAQPAPAPAGPPDLRSPRMQEHRQEREAHQRQRAQELAVVLNLRPDQQQALAAYEAALSSRRPRTWDQDRSETQNLSTPQLLDRRLERMDRRMAQFRQRAEATKAFYASLSLEQQRVFDILQRREGGRWGGTEGPGGDRGRGAWGRHGSPAAPGV